MAIISTFTFPTTIVFGSGARDLVGVHLHERGLQRPLLVTDELVGGLGMFTDFIANLAAGGLDPTAFTGVAGEPLGSEVAAGVEAYRAHEADSIIGFGGGAALDVAKAVGLLASHPGALFDYEAKPTGEPIWDTLPYLVAVPTTAGAGSEVGHRAVITDDDTGSSRTISSPHLLPKAVFTDPELTFDLPPAVTAATGMDALAHNIEAYLAHAYHPICDGIALEGVRLGHRHLARAVAHPRDLEARRGMSMCSLMGGIASEKGLGVVHAAAHALASIASLPHGLANAIMIDHAVAVNIDAVPERFTAMAVAIGLDDPTPEGFVRWLADLKAEIGIPRSLLDIEVPREAADRLARLAFADAAHASNPRPATEDDFITIFTHAFD